MKKIIATVLTSLTLAAGTPALAQNVAQNGAPDPAVVAAVKEMFASMHQREMLVKMMQQMSQSVGANIRNNTENAIKNNPNMDIIAKEQARADMEAKLPATVAAMQQFFNDPGLIDELVDATVPIYAREFTVDEVKQIAAFYRTPVGAKMLAMAPKLMGEGMQLSQQIVARRLGPMLQELQKKQQKESQDSKDSKPK